MESYSVTSIICPHCATALDPTDDVCHQCGTNTTSGVDTNDAPRSRMMDRPWLLVVVLLHVGVLGIPLYWKTKYSTSVRLAIIAVSIAYTLFAVTFIVLGCMFIIGKFRLLAQ